MQGLGTCFNLKVTNIGTLLKKYLLGLNFDEQMPEAYRLQTYRSRFDSKFSTESQLKLALLPPFEMDFRSISKYEEKFEEDAESYLLGVDLQEGMTFKEVDVFQGKKKILYAKPEIPEDLLYFQEGLDEFLLEVSKGYRRNLLKKVNRRKLFLPLGRFTDNSTMNFALDLAAMEIGFPLNLRPRQLILWEKSYSGWKVHNILHEFMENDGAFLQEGALSL